MLKDFKAKPIEAGLDQAFPRYPASSSVTDMFNAFWPLDRLIDDLYAGEVSYAGLTPVMIDHDGSYGEIVPSLNGWSSCMERIARRLDIPLDLGLLRRIGKRIENGILLDVAAIDRAKTLIDRCRAIYLACPVHVRKAATVDEFIEIEIEELGLRRAA
ncbi:MAG: hypothetical protein U0989_02615 [Azonexus sp.]|nr:hypothetical protein [Azonexus sp.]MDP3636986.1 hypothetical protein [Azonexus sp.]MDZ4313659.1 hypothetical protein [Azonexus sp.]